MSQQPEETVGLDLFDETASAAGSFPHAMRGYERQAVDAYVRDIERQLSSAKRKVRSLQQRLSVQATETDYSRLGSHIGGVLNGSDHQAKEIVQNAQTEAEQIRDDARREAERRILDADRQADEARVRGVDALRTLREQLSGQTEAELAAAQEQARILREAAENHRAIVLADADRNAAALREQAAMEADQIRQAAEREVAEIRAALAKEQSETLEAMQQHQAEVTRALIELSERARQQSDDFGAQMARDASLADERRQKAMAQADQVLVAANEEASVALAQAHTQARAVVDEAGVAESVKVEQLRHEIAGLEQRKKALVDAFEQVSALASSGVAGFRGDQLVEPTTSVADDAETAVLDLDEGPATAIEPAIEADDDATRVQPAAAGGGGKRR